MREGEKKKHEIAPEKQKITSRSSAAVESGETKAKSISQQRRWRSRKQAAEDEDDDEEEDGRDEEEDEVCSRGHNWEATTTTGLLLATTWRYADVALAQNFSPPP